MTRDYVPASAFQSNDHFEEWWWNTPHDRCRHCSGACKQSNHVKILDCPQHSPYYESDEQDGDAEASIKESLRLEIAPVAKSLAGETS